MRKGNSTELREEFRCNKLGLDHAEPYLFVVPQCFPSKAYIGWVIFWALFYTSTLGLEIYYNINTGGTYFIYLTNWSYCLQFFLVYTDLAVTLYTHLRRKDVLDGSASSTPWYTRALWVIYTTNNTIAPLVTLLYYILLNPEFNHGSINTHLLNSVYTLLTVIVCAKPVRLLHFYQPVIYSILYIIFTLIWHYTGNEPVYEILDWHEPGSTARLTLLVAFVATPIMHLLMFALYTFRLWISEKCQCTGSSIPNDKLQKDVTSNDVKLQMPPNARQNGNINSVSPE